MLGVVSKGFRLTTRRDHPLPICVTAGFPLDIVVERQRESSKNLLVPHCVPRGRSGNS